MKIAVDFDGTIVTHEYPAIGEELPVCHGNSSPTYGRGASTHPLECQRGRNIR